MTYIAKTIEYIPTLFQQSDSPEAIITTATLASLAFVPGVGFGFKGGFNVGMELTSPHVPLSYLYIAKLYSSLKWIIRSLALF